VRAFLFSILNVFSILIIGGAGVGTAAAQSAASKLTLETGKQIYDSGCVACHGPDGKGQSRNLAGFEPPSTFPDFSDCPTAAVEPDYQWRAIITNGGAARAFSTIMPSFRELLTQEQIGKVVAHLRTFCADDAWPRGNLNLPRAQITEKAFPEDETVITGTISAHGSPGIGSTLIYEKRIGATGGLEAIVPFDFTRENGSWGTAFGDLALGYKQTLFHSLARGSIFSAGGELSVPTGDAAAGSGGVSTVFEASAAYGQLLPASSFLQVHTGFELPAHPAEVSRVYFLRTAIGKTFSQEGGHGRRWSPIVEFIAERDLVSGGTTNWDIVPELQIPLSKRMHILGSVGLRIPANNTDGRQKQLLFYALWDWMDGGLREGW
jgi:mono/diheme cytochrome c family protein